MISLITASIPSPSQSVWWIGPVPLRAYSILIMIGIIVAVWWSSKRYAARGGNPEVLYDVALWAIPFGIIGARVYHVITSPEKYFGEGGDPMAVFYIWEGGIGIWGAVSLGALGVWLALRRRGARLGPVADSIAPALLVAQAIGRWGNWFNQELFGSPTTLPWGLQIDAAHMPAGYAAGTLFHPTFLYESLWNLAGAALIVLVERRRRLASGQSIALYMVVYSLGRFWIEGLRIDAAQVVGGMRLNQWTSLAVMALGVALFALAGRAARPARLAIDEGGAAPLPEEDQGEDVDAAEAEEEEAGDSTGVTGATKGDPECDSDAPKGRRDPGPL